MPFVSPTIPFTSSISSPLTGVIVRQSASSDGVFGRLDASIAAFPPFGGMATTTSLGANIGAAPPNVSFLVVFASTASFENGIVAAAIGTAEAKASLSVFVEEFDSNGAFIRARAGQPTVVFDAAAFFIGAQLRVNETQTRSAFMIMPVVGGNIYRIWLDSFQFVSVVGGPVADAGSNFTYDFSPLFFSFI